MSITLVKILATTALGILAYISIREIDKHFPAPLGSIALIIASGVVMLFSYFLLFWYVSLTVGRVLGPWDQWMAYAPPLGSWQRQLNDFFSQDIHQHALAFIVTGMSMAIFLVGAFRRRAAMLYKLALFFASTNLLFLLIDVATVILLAGLRADERIGYRQISPDLLTTFALLVMLFWAQARIALRSSE